MKAIRLLLVGAILGTILVVAPVVVGQSHFDEAQASWATCHSPLNTNIHELSNPPASWPGTRAAHVTYTYSGSHSGHTDVWIVSDRYTKNGYLDPTWDYYNSIHTNYSHNCT